MISVKLFARGFGLFSARHHSANHQPVKNDILLPNEDGKWEFTPGVDVPPEFEELEYCEVNLTRKGLFGRDVFFTLKVSDDIMKYLNQQMKINKRTHRI